MLDELANHLNRMPLIPDVAICLRLQGDSSKFDRAHSQQSQQSPQTPHRTVAERAAEERLRANGGSGNLAAVSACCFFRAGERLKVGPG